MRLTRLRLKDVPFTLITLVLLATAGVLTGTHLGTISTDLIHRYGFAPRDLVTLDWSRVVTSAFLTEGGIDFWEGIGAIALFVGAAEYLRGTRRAALTFWGVHVATLGVLLILSAPFHLIGGNLGSLVYLARDIGPSAGYVGCLGLLLRSLQPRLRIPGLAIAFAWVAAALIINLQAVEPSAIQLSADAAHMIALGLGAASAGVSPRGTAAHPRDGGVS